MLDHITAAHPERLDKFQRDWFELPESFKEIWQSSSENPLFYRSHRSFDLYKWQSWKEALAQFYDHGTRNMYFVCEKSDVDCFENSVDRHLDEICNMIKDLGLDLASQKEQQEKQTGATRVRQMLSTIAVCDAFRQYIEELCDRVRKDGIDTYIAGTSCKPPCWDKLLCSYWTSSI